MRRFLFNHDHSLGDEYSILMWIYPSREQAIIRDIFIAENFGSGSTETIWTSAYKTFPLAFAFTQSKTKRELPYRGILDITRFLTKNIDDTFAVTFPLKDMPHQVWPEAPRKNSAIFMGDGQRLLTRPHTPNNKYQH